MHVHVDQFHVISECRSLYHCQMTLHARRRGSAVEASTFICICLHHLACTPNRRDRRACLCAVFEFAKAPRCLFPVRIPCHEVVSFVWHHGS